MKKNIARLVQAGILVPALVFSMAACGTSNTAGTAKSEETAPAQETEPEGTEETQPAEDGAQQEAAAAEDVVFENAGMKITLPAELADKITVGTPEKDEDGAIFTAYENASVEAEKAAGHQYEGAGWLFSICTRTEEDVHRIMCDDGSGSDIIGYGDDGVYYVYYHPTDVRYERETPEQMEKDQEQWAKACEWADSVFKTFAENNGITKVTWNSTMVEISLARTCYQDDAKYTLSTTEFGPLEPGDVDAEKYVKQLTTDAVYEIADGIEAPDGEYVVLNFPDDDVRFDFFIGEDSGNFIRQVWSDGENEEIYKVTFADSSKVASKIMQEWYAEIAKAAGK